MADDELKKAPSVAIDRSARPSGATEDPIVERVAGLEVTGLPRLNDSMGFLRGLIDAEYERLRLEWAALLAERDAINKIKDRIQSVNVGEHDRLRLNVSGLRFEIRASAALKNTLFRNLLSNTFTPADGDGFYYIDRDPKYVMVILNAIRDGDVDLDEYNERQLKQIEIESEFYMVGELTNKVRQILAARRTGLGIVGIPINRDVPTTLSFNGVFLELTVLKRGLGLHSISFVAGETRRIVAEAFCMEGGMDGPAKPSKIGEVEIDADRGAVITISFTAIALTGSTYTIGVYSPSCSTAVVACPTTMATRDFARTGFAVERSYHTTNSRGHWTRRAGQDEYDLVGELGISS